MKKRILCLLVAVGTISCLVGCNMQVVDMTYTFDKAIIELGNGEVIEGKVDSWKDYEDGDQIQVKIEGKTYLVHSSKITLIKE